ncbi:hypothetical protein [uncultured Sphaerochaeta sp.]|uniref:hypothetical protein n=1 Tax=uncultured Sphaerochaeta sp. TaxID=886478 RepID=UPI002A0A2641|nr:hypothetical protein [uncultured Sphaerochaeta sp.]
MKKYILGFCLLILSVSLGAENLVSNATVSLKASIAVQDISIDMYYENGVKQDEEFDGLLSFEFPATDTWQVEQSVYFTYSSNVATTSRGVLSFTISPLKKNDGNILNTSIKLESENVMTSIRDGNSFNIGFLTGPQTKVAIGKLTVVVSKTSSQVFSSGLYSGSITLTFTNEA